MGFFGTLADFFGMAPLHGDDGAYETTTSYNPCQNTMGSIEAWPGSSAHNPVYYQYRTWFERNDEYMKEQGFEFCMVRPTILGSEEFVYRRRV